MRQGGMTLIELMIGMLMTSILALTAMSLLATNIKVSAQHTGHSAAVADAQQLFRILAEFVKQAEICATCAPAKTLDVTYPIAGNPNNTGVLTQNGDGIQIDFLLPAGYKIWPNEVAPYDNQAVRIDWSNITGVVSIKNTVSKVGLSGAAAQSLVVVTGRASRVVNIDLWPLAANGTKQAFASALPDGGYELCVGVRPPAQDADYTNPDDSGSLLHYRTALVCGVIFPRNW